MLVDSHCHLDRLDLTPYEGDLSRALKAAADQGVGHMLCVSIDMDTFANVLKIAEQYPNVSASVGVHPTEQGTYDPPLQELIRLASHPAVVAIGETGLDYYRSTGDLDWQRERFARHISAAKAVDKPIIVHSREAREDTLKILAKEQASEVGGVLHCFTENWDMAKRAMDLNFYISISGIVTFNSAVELKEIAKQIPLNRLLIETDAPYLAPVPHRGKPNEPAYVRYVAECIAELRGIPFDELAAQTSENFFALFKKTGQN
jgi:TatD DNase family protein